MTRLDSTRLDLLDLAPACTYTHTAVHTSCSQAGPVNVNAMQPSSSLLRGAKRVRSGVHAHISLEEVTFVAALLITMFGDACLLAAALAHGFEYLNSDAAIVLGDWVLVVEWDGELFHSSDERKANDVRKTKSIIAKHERVLVVRLRCKCGDLPELAGEQRVIIIETKPNAAGAAQQVAARLLASPILQMPCATIAARLTTSTAPKVINAAARAAAVAHYATLSAEFEKRFVELTAIAPTKVATILTRNSTRLVASGAAATYVSRLLAPPFCLSAAQLATFMCDGAAAAMERDTWWTRLASAAMERNALGKAATTPPPKKAATKPPPRAKGKAKKASPSVSGGDIAATLQRGHTATRPRRNAVTPQRYQDKSWEEEEESE